MLRPFSALVAFVVLGGCSSTFFSSPDYPTALDPGPIDYQLLVARDLYNQKNRAAMGPLDIAFPRKTRLAQPGDWIVCVRTTIEGRLAYLAIFIREDSVVDRRIAVQLDGCAQEQYVPLPDYQPPPPEPPPTAQKPPLRR